jgi:hypothetical protein
MEAALLLFHSVSSGYVKRFVRREDATIVAFLNHTSQALSPISYPNRDLIALVIKPNRIVGRHRRSQSRESVDDFSK